MQAIELTLEQLGVSANDIAKAKAYQKKYGGTIERLLVNMGSLSEDRLPEYYCSVLRLPLIDIEQYQEWQLCDNLKAAMNIDFFVQRGTVPLSNNDGVLLASKDPLNIEVTQVLQNLGQDYQLVIATESDFEYLLSKLSSQITSDEGELQILSDVEEDKLRELASEAPTVNLLNSLISRALAQGASDMHVEPQAGKYRVRYRIDGVLHEVETLPQRLQLAIISRLKILSSMDIAERRRPQDGKIEMKISNIPLDIRVSALPLNDGESMVLRFLRKDSVQYDMSVLGMSGDIEAKVSEDLQHTAGVILLTGPTGSGKTTTLYTFLNELNNDDVKIITLEDPVEYQLDGVNQVQVQPDIGFDFSAGLRSIVRQDPDVIMVGEIRDAETARIAMQSALTGHLVFSTVHTNDAPSAYTRLLDLGVEEFLLNAALISIVAQRLARKICPVCCVKDDSASELIQKYKLEELAGRFDIKELNIVKPVGCSECAHSGYRGRTAVIEYLRADEQIRSMPKDEFFIGKAKTHNKSQGSRTLLEDGLLKAIKGVTTVDEVIRVCG